MKMKTIIQILLLMSTSILLAAMCENEESGSKKDPNDPGSVCDYLIEHCNGEMWNYADQAECVKQESPIEPCRGECVFDTKDCEIMHDCLYYGHSDPAVSPYCVDGKTATAGSTDTQTTVGVSTDTSIPADTNDTSDTGSQSDDFDACADQFCPSESAACEANADCVGIYEQCYPVCNDGDLTCVAYCAIEYFPMGIQDHDVLYACLEDNCA